MLESLHSNQHLSSPRSLAFQPRYGSAAASTLKAAGHAVARLPWGAEIAKNEVYSRAFIEIVGYYAWQQLFARNNYERIEETVDTASHLALGSAVPVVLNRKLAQWAGQHFKMQFPGQVPDSGLKALDVPLEKLAQAVQSHPAAEAAPLKVGWKPSALEMMPKATVPLPEALMNKVGWKNTAMPKQLAQKLFATKLGLMTVDLFMLASTAQLFFWGKNVLTKKLSGKDGFSGILNYSSEDYRQQEQQQLEKTKNKRMLTSLALGFGGNLMLPALLAGVAKAKNVIPAAGKILGAFNYHKVVYQSKFVLMWSMLFNDTIASLLSSRGKAERRENVARFAAINFFYFVADDIIAARAAKKLEQKFAPALGGFKLTEKGLFGMNWAKSMNDLIKPAATREQALINELGMKIFNRGLLGTTLALGVALTLGSNMFTYLTVKRADKKLQAQKASQETSPKARPRSSQKAFSGEQFTSKLFHPGPLPTLPQPNYPVYYQPTAVQQPFVSPTNAAPSQYWQY